MTTTKDFANYVVQQFSTFGDPKVRPMMGEYLLYQDGILIGGIYDGRILLKTTEHNQKYNLPTQLPYPSAKRLMYALDNLDNLELVREIIMTTIQDLPKKEVKILPNDN